MSWIAALNAASVSAVARALGLDVVDRSPPQLTPCPSCGATTRGSADVRAPVGLTTDGRGWRCFRCGTGGTGVTLAACALLGEQPRRGDPRWNDVRRWAAAQALCLSSDGPPRWQPRRPTVPAPSPSTRLPQADIMAFWDSLSAVADDHEAVAWLRSARGLDSAVVSDRDLARSLPPSQSTPRWARFRGRPWTLSGHRLIVAMFGPTGALESVRARCLLPSIPPGEKSASPAGAQVRGLVMADALGRRMLEGSQLGDGSSAADLVRRVGLVVAEGEPDFLTWATRGGDAAEDAPAVIGVVAGSWTDELATRVPVGARVVVRTHSDAAGDKYAARVAATLGSRCRVLRAGGAA